MSYADPISDGSYGDGSLTAPAPCPVCGAPLGQCSDGTWADDMPLPPVDLHDVADSDTGGPLRTYRVTQWGYPTTMQLNDADAAAYGDAAELVT